MLDPFAGGGAIPLEALRLGCDAHAIDLNPVAHLIELCTLVYPQKYGQPDSRPVPDYIKRLNAHNRAKTKRKNGAGLFDKGDDSGDVKDGETSPDVEITEAEYRKNPLLADYRFWACRSSKRLGTRFGGSMSPKHSPRPTAFLWTRTIECPNPRCRCELPLLQSTALVEKNGATTFLVTEYKDRVLSLRLDTSNTPEEAQLSGTLSRNSAICPKCSSVVGKTDLETIGKSSGFGVKMTCVVESSGKGKTYRAPNENDAFRFQAAAECLTRTTSNDPRAWNSIPNEELPYLRSIFNVHVYGLNTWGKLFNARQLMTLTTLVACIRGAIEKIATHHDAEYALAIASYLTLTLGRQTDYCSTLCAWLPQGEFLGHTFTRQALGMFWDHAEGNPFSSTTGNWEGAVNWISRVIEFLSSTRMPIGVVRQGDATQTGYENSSLDCVITDPPYYDAVPYSNLSDYFYVWFRRVLGTEMPDVFRTPLTPKGPELVQLAERNTIYKHKTKEFFENGMKKAFLDGSRVLGDEGLYTVVYAHKTTAAWETLVNALIGSGLSVKASWPLNTERPGRMRSDDSAALASSVFLVCRKRSKLSGDGLWDDVRNELQQVAKERSTSSGHKAFAEPTSSSRPSAQPCPFLASTNASPSCQAKR